MKKRNKTKFLWYMMAVGVLLIFSLILLSSLIDIGERLRNISMYVEIGFYVLVAFVIIFAIIRPIVIIVKSPSLSIVTLGNADEKKSVRIYKKVAKNIVANNDLPQEQRLMLTSYKNPEELVFNINYVFENTIKKEMNSIILKNDKTVMISTAINQS